MVQNKIEITYDLTSKRRSAIKKRFLIIDVQESKENTVIISSNIPEIGNVEEKITVEKPEDNDIKIAFNSKFMMDCIKVIESDELELLFNGEFKPIIIKNPESDDLIGLILPIRTY